MHRGGERDKVCGTEIVRVYEMSRKEESDEMVRRAFYTSHMCRSPSREFAKRRKNDCV